MSSAASCARPTSRVPCGRASSLAKSAWSCKATGPGPTGLHLPTASLAANNHSEGGPQTSQGGGGGAATRDRLGSLIGRFLGPDPPARFVHPPQEPGRLQAPASALRARAPSGHFSGLGRCSRSRKACTSWTAMRPELWAPWSHWAGRADPNRQVNIEWRHSREPGKPQPEDATDDTASLRQHDNIKDKAIFTRFFTW